MSGIKKILFPVMAQPTAAADGRQEMTDHALGWGWISDPGKHLQNNQGGEIYKHRVPYCSLKQQITFSAFNVSCWCLIMENDQILHFHHLNLGCSWFGISERQRTPTNSKLIFENKSALR